MSVVGWSGPALALAGRIERYVQAALADRPEPEPFERLALAISEHQAATSRVSAALRSGPDPTSWLEIPAVPVELFKDVDVGDVGAEEAAVEFRTSGTTSGARGVHRLRSTRLTDLAAMGFAARCVPGAPADVVALLLDPADAPESSLSYMVRGFARTGHVSWHLPDGQLDREGADRAVGAATGPIWLCATSFALAEWLTAPASEEAPPAASGAREIPPLPPGSVLMVTGGFKGRVFSLDERALLALASERLRPSRCFLEYGMTELSSQLWASFGRDGVPEAYRAPRWMRVVAVDPATGAPRPAGEPGQLRFVDLCNLDSSVCIDTFDEGVVHADGSVSLFGRLRGAAARGCSLTVEEAWSAAVRARGAGSGMSFDAAARLRDAIADAVRKTNPAPARALGIDAFVDAMSDAVLARLASRSNGPAWRRATFVAARTVDTAPLEFILVLLASGVPVTWKYPRGEPGLAIRVGQIASELGLPLETTDDPGAIARQSSDDLVICMGSDETVASVRPTAAPARFLGFGARFSIAYLEDVDAIPKLAPDFAAHDGRGCLSPVAVFSPAPTAVALEATANALRAASSRWPRGSVSDGEAAAIRARIALGRVVGSVAVGDTWSAVALPTHLFRPAALPRSVTVHGGIDRARFRELCRAFAGSLSTIGSDVELDGLPEDSRFTSPGEMQRPPVERLHDGVDWLSVVLGG